MLDFIKKLRTGGGFGVHSPFAYNFIKDVITEKYPYTAYRLQRRRTSSKKTAEKSHLFFRTGVRFHDFSFAFFGKESSPFLAAIKDVDSRKKVLINPEALNNDEKWYIGIDGDCNPEILITLLHRGNTVMVFSSNDGIFHSISENIKSGAMTFSAKGCGIIVGLSHLPFQQFKLF